MPTEKTFSLQDSLPSLSVPDLDQTVESYLESAKVHLSPDEFETTERIARSFLAGEGKILHEHLLKKAANSRNWLEKWWEDCSYLELRYPLVPFINYGGSSQDFQNLPPLIGSQEERAANAAWLIMAHWEKMRKEEIPVMKSRGTVWCMEQNHRIFNSCRIPGFEKDELTFYFMTIAEGPCPNHLIVLCGGRIWKLSVVGDDGAMFSPPQIQRALGIIRRVSSVAGPYVNALTCLDRTNWARAREHLINLDPNNEAHLKAIETSVLILSLTDECPEDNDAVRVALCLLSLEQPFQLAYLSIACSPRNVWADKACNWLVHFNGLTCTCNEHSVIDAVILLQMSNFVDEEAKKMGYKWNGPTQDTPYPIPVELKFRIDEHIEYGIMKAIEISETYSSDLAVTVLEFTEFALDFFREKKIYADSAIQLALQLAYWRMHGKPAPTYETASTRKFWHGRTDTVRSCTAEAADWAKTALSPHQTGEYSKFEIALNKQNELMLAGVTGEGLDRHLLGLRLMSRELGMAEPELFRDVAWKKSGGDGNFVLSTSFIGYSNVWGGVSPMMLDGYGCFYKIQNHRLTLFFATWKSSKETDLVVWKENVIWALRHIRQLMDSASRSKL